jgi:cyanophycin synthetase
MANSVTRGLIIAEAERRGFKVKSTGKNAYFCQITTPDGRTEIFHGSRPSRTSAHGYDIASDKDLSMQFIQALGYTVPGYAVCDSLESAIAAQEKLGVVVVKPNDGSQSKGVTIGVNTKQSLKTAYNNAINASVDKRVIVQEQLQGQLYRILVINGKFVAAVCKTAPQIYGNGEHTVKELVDRFNAGARRGEEASAVLKVVKPEVVAGLYGVDILDTILPTGKSLVLGVDSISAGGEAIDVTDDVHSEWKKICETISKEAGLFVNGIDVICADISLPPPDNALPILEVNHMPGLGAHHYPTGGGRSIDVTRTLFDELF